MFEPKVGIHCVTRDGQVVGPMIYEKGHMYPWRAAGMFSIGEPAHFAMWWQNGQMFIEPGPLDLVGEWVPPLSASPTHIALTAAEIETGFDRVRWAAELVRQLPPTHEGRNTWLSYYGGDSAARPREPDAADIKSNPDIELQKVLDAYHQQTGKWVVVTTGTGELDCEVVYTKQATRPKAGM